MQNTSNGPRFHALLIGINHYLPNRLPNGLYYKSLFGCVSDVNLVEAFLRRELQLPNENITKLTSSTPVTGNEPPEPRSQWPTYENIVNAFKRLTEVAQPDDQVLIHYSGHGGRAITTDQFKDVKGQTGIDEVVVPMDLGDSEGRYLRDTELHFLLQKMVQKQLYVTLVLDSCHSGGGTRNLLDPYDGSVGVRGVDVIDTIHRPKESLVASTQELRQAWQGGAPDGEQGGVRNAEVASNWLLEPQGYVLIAACRANEYANEVVFEGHEKNGALSYWLVDSLKQIGPDFTYAMLHSRLLAKVHGQFAIQSPQLQGEGQRVVFGATERPQPRSFPVISAEPNGPVLINAGLAQGIAQGTQFGIYPTTEADFSNSEKRVAVVEVTETSPVNCQARIVDHDDAPTIEAGYHAVRLDGGKIRLSGRVRVIHKDQSEDAVAALKAVEDALEASSGVVSAAKNVEAPDYLITIARDAFVICDATGTPITNLLPAIRVHDDNAVARVLDRLIHLVKYTNVRELDNNDSTSRISQKFIVEFVNAPPDFTPGLPIRPQPLASIGPSVKVVHGEWAFLRIRNEYEPNVLNVTVLDLQSDWGISQIYPARAGSYEPLDPNRELILPLKITLPEGYQAGTDVIKVFATIDSTSFRSLELPPLDKPEMRDRVFRGAPNALEAFLANFESPHRARTAAVDVCAATEWAAHQVEIEIVREHQQAFGVASANPSSATPASPSHDDQEYQR
ncbi:MAG TPA: caspase family protein [Pyrinomonadaceae bacterium]|nr:caspase family protein [Pyrinomonadaceae bacterium]